MAQKSLCRASRFKSAPSCWNDLVSWSLGRSCARRYGPKIPLSTSTTPSILRLKKFELHWETRPTIPGLFRPSPAGYRFICPVLTGDGQLAEAEYPAAAATPVVETG